MLKLSDRAVCPVGKIYQIHTERDGKNISALFVYRMSGDMPHDIILLLKSTEPRAYLVDLMGWAYVIERRMLPHLNGFIAIADSVLPKEPVTYHIEALMTGIVRGWMSDAKRY